MNLSYFPRETARARAIGPRPGWIQPKLGVENAYAATKKRGGGERGLLPSFFCISNRICATRAIANIGAGSSAAFGRKITGATSTFSGAWQQFMVQAAIPAFSPAS